MKKTLRGIAASPGVGIGKTLVYKAVELNNLERAVQDCPREIARFRAAAEAFASLWAGRAARVASSAGQDHGDILLSQTEMVRDPYLTTAIERRITQHRSAEAAVAEVCGDVVRQFLSAENELTRLRAADIRDIRDGLLRLLLGLPEVDFSNILPGTVLIAEDLPPSVMSALDPKSVAGIVLCRGGRASHSAILARALQIPTVVGAAEALSWAVNGEPVVVDGVTGEALLAPTPEELYAAKEKQTAYRANLAGLRRFAGRPTVTAEGAPVRMDVTVGSEGEARQAGEYGYDGIGLLRSEFLYLERSSLPEEEEQFRVYRRFAEMAAGRPVVIRTLDIGGDKRIPGLSWDWENNPMLGRRSVRLCLERDDLLRTQLRAILRAGAYGNVRMLLPMLSGVDELRKVKAILDQCREELRRENIPFREDMPLGVMMETAASALVADLLAEEADFFSIGMNDLTQYTLAVDRDNAQVAYLYSYYAPPVLRAAERVVACGKAAGIPVNLCGQAAADPLFVPLLLAMGIEAFSVQPSSLLEVRKSVSLWTRPEAAQVWEQVRAMKTEAEVHAFLTACQRF